MRNRQRITPETILKFVQIVLALAVAAVVLLAVVNVKKSEAASGRDRLEQSIRRGVMACYAQEGVYPPDIEYLRQNYALEYDEEKYSVRYDIFAENLMPYITVIVLGSK